MHKYNYNYNKDFYKLFVSASKKNKNLDIKRVCLSIQLHQNKLWQNLIEYMKNHNMHTTYMLNVI